MNTVKNMVFSFLAGTFFLIGIVNAESSTVVDAISISPQLKKHIMQSAFKVNLQRGDGKKIVAYLYANDERSEMVEDYSCISGVPQKFNSKIGHYHIYLYDVNTGSFSQNRTKIFDGFKETRLNVEGADLIVLSGAKAKKSDVLLVSQFGDCNGNFFEVFGFSENQSFLKNYIFVARQKQKQFYGRIGKSKGDSQLVAYGVYDSNTDKIEKMNLYLSNKNGEIQLRRALG